jgi:hypothetical protein
MEITHTAKKNFFFVAKKFGIFSYFAKILKKYLPLVPKFKQLL